MGDFWNRHKLDNGRPMSPRQIKRVEELEDTIEWKCAEIENCEMEIKKIAEQIAQIKRGGRKKLVTASDLSF